MMRVAPWVIVTATVLLVLPFGWGLGVLVAYLIGGKNFAQIPVATVPLGILAALVFAVRPSLDASFRLKILGVGAACSSCSHG
ncbi:MAG TPA: hypothetical protein VKV24_06630 [Casimicrobiaceae bacterium]|nr:hypothetical protein [Casimicrobiaceae bacterium]